MRCRRRRPRRRPWGPGRVSGARLYRTHRPKTPRRAPPTKTRRKKRKVLPPSRGDKKRKAAPSGGLKGPRREGPSFRTAPQPPPIATTSGCLGISPWRSRKYSDTIIILVCFVLLFLIMPNMIMQSVPRSSRRTLAERLFGLVGYEQRFSSDRFHPSPYGQRRGFV